MRPSEGGRAQTTTETFTLGAKNPLRQACISGDNHQKARYDGPAVDGATAGFFVGQTTLFLKIPVDLDLSWVYAICTMKLITKEIEAKLVKVGYANMKPICKLFTPWGRATWLITGMEDGILYGFADLGMGCVEWGGIDTVEGLESIKGPFGLRVERDLHWSAPEGEVNYCTLDNLATV